MSCTYDAEVSLCTFLGTNSSWRMFAPYYIRLVQSTISQWIKWRTLLTIYTFNLFGMCIDNTDEDRSRIIHLARKMPGHTIKKVYTWLPFIMQLKFIYCAPHRYSSCCTFYRSSAASGLSQDAASICLVLKCFDQYSLLLSLLYQLGLSGCVNFCIMVIFIKTSRFWLYHDYNQIRK